ncbi:hypothetical protein [Lyngbya aestuarii]|uniref:hypothetical protein n=1 Tax=Lyngbya aestuarii TaxID=118322 RepID=UPI00403E06E9
MSDTIGTIFGFLGGTILSCDGGYQVLQHPNPNRVYQRLSEAKWFLAMRWCEQFKEPSGILNHEGQLSFYNEAALKIGGDTFLPPAQRKAIFKQCVSQQAGEIKVYSFPCSDGKSTYPLEVVGIDLDPRFGRVALVRKL